MKASFKFIIAALAATAAMAGCVQEITPPNFENDKVNPDAEGSRVIAVSFAPQTKTTLEGLQPKFEDGKDTVLISNTNALDTCVVSVKDNKATISTDLTGPLTAVYPYSAAGMSEDNGNEIDTVLVSTEQSGTFADANICMAKMTSENDESLSFENKTAVFCIYPPTDNPEYVEVSAEGFDIANDVPTGSTHTIHVASITTDSVYVSILVPEGLKAGSLTFSDGTKVKTIKDERASTAIAAGTLYTVTNEGWESPAPAAGTPDGALKGVFTVDDNSTDDPSDDIRVYFSQGNLYCKRTSSSSNVWTWHFYEKQYEFKTDYPQNKSGMNYTTEEDTEMTLFTWGYDPSNLSPVGEKYVKNHPQENDILVYDKPSSDGGDDWGVAYCESNDITVGTWRTLTTWEWRSLVNKKRMKYVDFCYSDRTGGGGVLIEGSYYKGVFLYPDDYSGIEVSSSMTWDEINDAGIVFLPAAGYRDGSDLGYYDASICFYWSASAYNKDLAFHVKADGSGPTMYLYGNRAEGHSVRLVTNAAPEGFVDLGVVVNNRPVYWAEKNLGAGEPAEFGYYFSWGDVTGQPISKNVFHNDSFEKAFDWDDYDVFGKSFEKVTEETACPNGILLPAWDAAARKNKTWRMPTSEEFHALFEQCFAEWTDNYNNTGKAGVIVWKAKGDDAGWFKPQTAGIGREYPNYYETEHSFNNKYNPNTDSHVFFPAAGYGVGNTFANPLTTGYYWSSTLFNDSKKEDAQLLSFNTNTISINARAYRYYGNPIRPVYVPAPGSTIDYFHVSNDDMSCWE